MFFRMRDPRKTTGLIGRVCTHRNMFSKAVLTVKDLVMPTGLRHCFHSSFGTALAVSSYSGMKLKQGRRSNDL